MQKDNSLVLFSYYSYNSCKLPKQVMSLRFTGDMFKTLERR